MGVPDVQLVIHQLLSAVPMQCVVGMLHRTWVHGCSPPKVGAEVGSIGIFCRCAAAPPCVSTMPQRSPCLVCAEPVLRQSDHGVGCQARPLVHEVPQLQLFKASAWSHRYGSDRRSPGALSAS